LTFKELENFVSCREASEEVGIDFKNKDQFLNLLYDIDEMDQDPKRIIDEMKEIRFIKVTKVELQERCDELEKNLELYKSKEQEQKRYWNSFYPAMDLFNKLLLRGMNPDVVYNILDVISKYQPYLSVDDLVKDIHTYGGIKSAIFKNARDLERIITDKQNLYVSRDLIS